MRKSPSRKHLRACLVAVAAVSCAAALARADDDSPVDYLQVNSPTAQTFMDGDAQVVLVEGPVTIQTDRATLSAKAAVIWFTPVEGASVGRQRAEIALIGDATLEQASVSRGGDTLFVTTVVGGPVRLCVQSRENSDLRGSAVYQRALAVRPALLSGADVHDNILVARPSLNDPPSPEPTTRPATQPTPKAPVVFNATTVQTTTNTPDGRIAVVLRGGVLLTQRRPNGDYVEMQADQAVLYTTLTDFTDASGDIKTVQDAVQSAYLEGDVRVNYTPSGGGNGRVSRQAGEQRLRAKRVYYEFATDRAVLTDVVLQAVDPRLPFPITMRANAAKQLSLGEFNTQKVVLTTSQFASPSYSLNATRAYVRQYQDPDPLVGARTAFESKNATFRFFGVPLFYLPYAAGNIATNAFPLRALSFGSTRGLGFGVESTWGLFESVGRVQPPGIDAQYHLDYFSDRGPAAGLDVKYKGGDLARTTKDGWNFDGNFSVYGLYDNGADNLGRDRSRINQDDDLRGRLQWEHQQILPDDWQAQFRVGLTSDATFLEEFYRKQFDDGLPTNLSAYFKHQTGQEAVTFLAEYQPNDVVTNADSLQNRFVGDRDNAFGSTLGSLADRPFEVDRLPELGYYRVGESFDDDQLTFLSENRLGGYRMNESGATLGLQSEGDRDQYGFQANAGRDRYALPGIPSLGYTGTTEDYVVRGDFRQEVDYPIDAGRFKVVPYVFGRYTGYSDGPQDDPENRLMAGVGTRVNTSFWKVDDGAQSDFFDLHRVRHVVEPEVNLFASAATIERNDVYVYDDTIDGINDVSAASFFVRQRWQTKRGAPGLYRSVDFLTLNVGVVGFANTPSEPQNPDRAYARGLPTPREDEDEFGPTSAKGFRGLYFQATPEASIPRSSIQGDASWRVSDTTLLLGDTSWNIEEQQLSTAAAGFLVGRGDRVNYYTGLRYIGEIDSTIASFTASYQLTAKYTINFGVAIDLSRSDAKGGNASILRKFDRFYIGVGGYYDQTDNESGFTVAFYPEGLAGGVNSGQLQQFAR